MLVAEATALGIVTGIRGSFRYRAAVCHGAYAHSGATPRAQRRDSVRAVARLITAMDDLWQRHAAMGSDLTVTFGQVSTDPLEAAFSKVAGKVTFALDVRSAEPETLSAVDAALADLIRDIENAEGVRFDLGPRSGSSPAQMDPGLVAALGTAADDACIATRVMACGAGHDAAVFAQMGVPTAMVFVRNENGSHNPDEAMTLDDFAAGAAVVARIVANPPDLWP